MSALRHNMTRPASSGFCAPGGRSARSVEIRWLGATSASSSNQNADMAVSTRPLSGMGSFMTTSKAESRSDVTSSSRPSPAS